jgi:hypothetical protein
MRGQDAADDWAAIVREQGGLRENPLEPEQSLLLLNATGAVPHEGGRRFAHDSVEGKAMLDWLRAGASDSPDAAQPVELSVTPTSEFLWSRASLSKFVQWRSLPMEASVTSPVSRFMTRAISSRVSRTMVGWTR